MTAIFAQLGFEPAEGPEAESDSYNFTDLNILKDHPARDLHDTFYLDAREKKGDEALLMRTHTSPVQVRLMSALAAKAKKENAPLPPVRMIAPGRVFRHEATDATHAAVFHQVEGLAVDRNIGFSDLKGILTYFARRLLGNDLQVRFRPSYFPFVEPGAEMDVQCFMCKGTKKMPSGENCTVCRGNGWVEILGAGMVHPQVLRNVGYDPEIMSGFAFGIGVERIVMALHQIRDIRYFLESDLRFLEQF
jgi:phenylalanyl-tRNA synthetase alpha chain